MQLAFHPEEGIQYISTIGKCKKSNKHRSLKANIYRFHKNSKTIQFLQAINSMAEKKLCRLFSRKIYRLKIDSIEDCVYELNYFIVNSEIYNRIFPSSTRLFNCSIV